MCEQARRCREILESGSEAAVIGDRIAEVDQERRRLERQLGRKPTQRPLMPAEVKALVVRLKDIVAVLGRADPDVKRRVYEELGVRLTYHPDGRVHVEAGAPRVVGVGVAEAITP